MDFSLYKKKYKMMIRKISVFTNRIVGSTYTCCEMQSSSAQQQVVAVHTVTSRLLKVNRFTAQLRKNLKYYTALSFTNTT